MLCGICIEDKVALEGDCEVRDAGLGTLVEELIRDWADLLEGFPECECEGEEDEDEDWEATEAESKADTSYTLRHDMTWSDNEV